MRIVVLDGYALNPGDLSWDELRELGDCDIHDRTSPDKLLEHSKGAEVLLTNKTVLDENILKQLPDLKYIGVLATGYNVVDIEAAAEKRIPVTNVPVYSTQSVAQMVFAHILNFCNRVSEHTSSVRNGTWSNSNDFCFWEFPLMELKGKTLGIIGLGKIGKSVANIAVSFGMRVIAHNRSTPENIPDGVEMTNIDRVIKESDFLTLHCPLTDENNGFVNVEFLKLMKKSAFLINTSRGPLLEEKALADALNKEEIAGAGLDVLSKEPPSPENPLLSAKNCCITPHIAWATFEARERLMKTAIDNLQGFLAGNTENVVNGVN